MSNITFALEPLPPFRLDLTVWTLRRRPDNAVDRWDGQTYRRALVVEGVPVEVAVTQTASPDTPQLRVTATGAALPADVKQTLTATLERMLGLQIDLTEFYRLAARDAKLGPQAQRFRGAKPPRFPTLFETLVNAIACQQITLTLGIRLLNRLVETYGSGTHDQEGILTHTFPPPQSLSRLEVEALRELGFSRQKARALVELACVAAEGRLSADELVDLEDTAAVTRLRQLRGVGRWTAEYVLLRYMGRLHVFPGDDVGARNNLRRWLGLAKSLDYEEVAHTLAPWGSYSGLIYFHMLLNYQTEAGYMSGESNRL